MNNGLDLSKLPESIRSKLQAQLDKLPPEMRQQLLERGSPVLNRAIERAKQPPTVVPKHSTGHYSRTVQPGDRIHVSLAMIVMVIVAAGALYYLYGG